MFLGPYVNIRGSRITGYGKVELKNGQVAAFIEKPYTPDKLGWKLASVIESGRTKHNAKRMIEPLNREEI